MGNYRNPTGVMGYILVIDDDRAFCSVASLMVETLGHECLCAHSIKDGLAALARNEVDIVLLDDVLPDGIGLDYIDAVLGSRNSPAVAVMTARGDPRSAENALKAGAQDYIIKPLDIDQLAALALHIFQQREGDELEPEIAPEVREAIIGETPRFLHCLRQLAVAARSDGSVLLVGETGTGKELFAQALHYSSARKNNDFIVIDCTSLPEKLVESLLFGHRKGAFTGANEDRQGLFGLADGGTIFLDEIGELALENQKTLLRVLQEKRFRPISSAHEVSSDFRLVAATNRDLTAMVQNGRFRKDLFYRLQTVVIQLPPLRNRKGDLHLLVPHIIGQKCRELGIPPKECSADYMEALEAYSWPGNIRELQNVLYSSLLKARREPLMGYYHLPLYLRTHLTKMRIESRQAEGLRHPGSPEGTDYFDFIDRDPFPAIKQVREITINEMERSYLIQLIRRSRNSATRACFLSGLRRARLYELLQKHNLSLKE